jgi:L-lactate dehydrogenase complex protein LldG
VTAREDVLGRIRAALGADRPPAAAIPRDYPTQDVPDQDLSAVLDLLVDRLVDYRAVVHRTSASGVADAVAAAIRERGARSLVVPAGTPPEWLDGLDGVELLADEVPLSLAVLDGAEGVVTGCAVAVAETGTIVLDAGSAQGRRALSLVPDYHLCVVRAEQVVRGVPAALARLDPTRPLTFVSGPSATSDIELERVEGVHGPRTLVVVLVEPGV